MRLRPPSVLAPTATLSAPHVRDAMDVAGVMRGISLALIPCLLAGSHGTGRQIHLALGESGLAAAGWRGRVLGALGFTAGAGDVVTCTLHGLLHALPLLALCLAVSIGWVWIFARARGRPVVPGAFLVALLFTLAVPISTPWWQAAIALSFGVVLGQEVFGGTGRNIVHPAVAGVVFLMLAWPDPMHGGITADGLATLRAAGVTWSDAFLGSLPGPLGASSPLACLLGAVWLLGRALLPWRTVIAVLLGAIVAAWLLPWVGASPAPGIPGHWHLVLGSAAFGAIFFATDPVTSPMTSAGRWIHGLLLGGVIVLIRTCNPAHPEGTYFALLLGSVFAPLNDAVVVWAHTLRRRFHD